MMPIFAFAEDSQLFEVKNTEDTYREQLQKNRLQARIQHLQDLRKTARNVFEKNESMPLRALQQSILDFGDECLTLHEVFESNNKLFKKTKKSGNKINTRCEILSEKIESKGLEKSRKYWKNIDELLDQLLGLIPQ
jgi:hypothetical protein